ncbi:DNA-binding transcriptional regulator BolA-like isoform X1 [Styela clava]
MLKFPLHKSSIFIRYMASALNPVETSIIKKLTETFNPVYLDVVNESFKHNVPKGSETHFKVVVVSDKFSGKRLIDRHRDVNNILSKELEGSVHALSIQAKTPDQWEKSGQTIANTPPCLGGSKK